MATPLKRDPQLSRPARGDAPPAAAPDSRPLAGVTAGSPARDLQAQLWRQWPGARAEVRWSRGRSLAFIALTNGLFWLSLVWLLRALR